MDVYNPIFGITWPGPGVFGIAIVLSMLLLGLIVYIILLYLKAKEKEKAHNYQLFLFQVKRKGLNNFQIKILNNMAAYLKLKSPTTLIKDANLFESILSGFSDYLKRNSLNIEENESICKELIVIYEKLYIPKMQYQTLYSMKDIEDGQLIHIEGPGKSSYIGKIYGRDKKFLAVKLISNKKDLKNFQEGMNLKITLIRVNDGEYIAETTCNGIEEDNILIAMTDNLKKIREFRHQYINVMIPATIILEKLDEDNPEEKIEGVIFRLNEFECEIRTDSALNYNRKYTIVFEIPEFSFKIVSQLIASRTVENGKIYYSTMKFSEMSKAASAVLKNFIVNQE
jgi:hypothetical protein